MRSSSPRELPRPEDRCRGDLERWLGSAPERPCWRSEAFAEDLPVVAPVLAATPPPGAHGARLRPAWTWSFAVPMPVYPR